MFKLITNLIARIVSRRVRELELEVKSLHDLVADGITNEYSSFEVWRCFAMIYLHDHGVLETLLSAGMSQFMVRPEIETLHGTSSR